MKYKLVPNKLSGMVFDGQKMELVIYGQEWPSKCVPPHAQHRKVLLTLKKKKEHWEWAGFIGSTLNAEKISERRDYITMLSGSTKKKSTHWVAEAEI